MPPNAADPRVNWNPVGGTPLPPTWSQGPQGPPGPAGPPGTLITFTSTAHEEFLPAAAANTVTLAQTVTRVLMVARAGLVQSQADGQYGVSGKVITFGTAFNGSERVVVAYQTGGDGTTGQMVDTALRAYVQQIMAVLDPNGPPAPVP